MAAEKSAYKFSVPPGEFRRNSTPINPGRREKGIAGAITRFTQISSDKLNGILISHGYGTDSQTLKTVEKALNVRGKTLEGITLPNGSVMYQLKPYEIPVVAVTPPDEPLSAHTPIQSQPTPESFPLYPTGLSEEIHDPHPTSRLPRRMHTTPLPQSQELFRRKQKTRAKDRRQREHGSHSDSKWERKRR